MIDDSVGDFNVSEVLRCIHVGLLCGSIMCATMHSCGSIHVGLLCVQQRPEDRPNMLSVVLMLSRESLLPKPRQPGFYTDSPEANFSLSTPYSENKISYSSFEAR